MSLATDSCRNHRHLTIPEQQKMLAIKLRGHDTYYGIAGNYQGLWGFRCEVLRVWRYWLGRRSWAGKRLDVVPRTAQTSSAIVV
jgi:RNA-directed DNA polymerase